MNNENQLYTRSPEWDDPQRQTQIRGAGGRGIGKVRVSLLDPGNILEFSSDVDCRACKYTQDH